MPVQKARPLLRIHAAPKQGFQKASYIKLSQNRFLMCAIWILGKPVQPSNGLHSLDLIKYLKESRAALVQCMAGLAAGANSRPTWPAAAWLGSPEYGSILAKFNLSALLQGRAILLPSEKVAGVCSCYDLLLVR